MKKRYIAIILVILAVAIALLTYLNRPQTALNPNQLDICQGDVVLRTFTLEEIKSLPYLEIEKEIASSSSTHESGLWRCVPLRELLNRVDKALLEQAEQIISRAADGFVGAYTAREVQLGDNVLVAYAVDGVDLAAAQAGGSGPLRIVVVSDPFGNRSTKNLCQIEIRE